MSAPFSRLLRSLARFAREGIDPKHSVRSVQMKVWRVVARPWLRWEDEKLQERPVAALERQEASLLWEVAERAVGQPFAPECAREA